MLSQPKIPSAPTYHSCPQIRHERGLLRTFIREGKGHHAGLAGRLSVFGAVQQFGEPGFMTLGDEVADLLHPQAVAQQIALCHLLVDTK
jgi:hypothetical protein